MSYEGKLALLLVLSAAVGWIAARLAGNAIFRKLSDKRIINNIISTTAQELFTADTLIAKLQDPTLLSGLNPMIEKHIEEFLLVKLTQKLPFVATFMGESTLAKIKEGMIEEINLLLPSVMAQYSRNLGAQLDISTIVTGKLSAIPADKFQAMIEPHIRQQQWKLQAGGAVLGLAIAALSAFILSL
jgi:uncharacterized membrane protein YheB (UPF0754 family)